MHQENRARKFCERLIGTIRRECLDWLIPVGEVHLRRILREWVTHYNRGRPHSSLGPGIPEPLQAKVPAGVHRHELPKDYRVVSKSLLGGLWRIRREPTSMATKTYKPGRSPLQKAQHGHDHPHR